MFPGFHDGYHTRQGIKQALKLAVHAAKKIIDNPHTPPAVRDAAYDTYREALKLYHKARETKK